RYEDANASAQDAAHWGVGPEQLIWSTVVFAGTATSTCLTSSTGESLVRIAFAAGAATGLDWTTCASLSMLTARPLVRLPSSWVADAALALTKTAAVEVYVFEVFTTKAAAARMPRQAQTSTIHQRR